MTDVQKTSRRMIGSIDEALTLYTPPPAGFAGRMGMEVEMPLISCDVGRALVPSPAEMQRLQQALKAQGYDAQLEPAGVLECASPSFPVDAVADLMASVKEQVAAFTAAASDMRLARVPFSIVPSTTEQEALDNTVARERLQVSIKAMREIFPPETLRLPLLTAGVQVSFSPRDAEDMFRMAYRAYALTPLLMAACNSCSGYVAGGEMRLDYLPRAKYYLGYGAGGGLSEAFLQASGGEDFIRRHAAEVFAATMHFAYDLDGNLLPAGRGNRITFAGLVAQGLNTQSNYELAESFLYNDIKICNLRDGDGNVVGKRLEVRGADAGIDQPAMALLLTAAVVPAGPSAEAFETLLKAYGFTGNPREDADLLQQARAAVTDHGGRFMDVDFGRDPESGAPRSLRDFAADMTDILLSRYEASPELAADVAQLVDVLVTGDCDARKFSKILPDLAAASAYSMPPAKAAPAGVKTSGLRISAG